jgi:hypothetical protein
VDEEKFDVVIKALQEYHDHLWKMTSGNSDWGIMDHIRLEQMDQLKKAMLCWKKHKHEWIDDETE